MTKYKITLGLGLMGNLHERTITVRASNATEAVFTARQRYYNDVRMEMGFDAQLWETVICIEKLNVSKLVHYYD